MGTAAEDWAGSAGVCGAATGSAVVGEPAGAPRAATIEAAVGSGPASGAFASVGAIFSLAGTVVAAAPSPKRSS